MFTKQVDGNRTIYRFTAAKYDFYVFHSSVGYWTVYRQQRGCQLRTLGKIFWKTNEMISHYKTAAVQLAMIAADSRAVIA